MYCYKMLNNSLKYNKAFYFLHEYNNDIIFSYFPNRSNLKYILKLN